MPVHLLILAPINPFMKQQKIQSMTWSINNLVNLQRHGNQDPEQTSQSPEQYRLDDSRK